MNRTLYDVNIKAVKINEITIRIVADNYMGLFFRHHVMQKEYDFLEDILDAFANNENIVNSILRIAKEYEGYDKELN